MKLDYQEFIEDQKIDINKLRPKKSYAHLISNRNHALKEILNDDGNIPQEYLVNRMCPSCLHDKKHFVFRKDFFHGVACNNCGLIFINPALKDEYCKSIYQSTDYVNIVKQLGEDSHIYRKERFGIERITNIEKYFDFSMPKRLMEIGCSTGFLLEVAQEKGWDAIGLELNPSAVSFGKKRGLKILNNSLDTVDFGDKKFSVITMYDVLEHLLYPQEMLKRVNSLLLDGGFIFIYVPNYQSASKELLGIEHAHFIWPTHHLTYFTPATLKKFLENYGFEILHWETQGLDLDDWLWYLKEKTEKDTTLIENHKTFFQFAINASGYGKNLRMYARKVTHA